MSLGCEISPVIPVKVTTANESVLTYEAQCYNFSWKMQWRTYITNVLLIELDTYDMVFGV